MSDAFASTNWHVAEGREEEFMQLWRDALTWTKDKFDDFERARLLRDRADASHLVSFIEWDSAEALDGWRNDPGFKERYAALESLCREVVGSTYEEGARVG
jgi:heme-degrading monooxygenase HmoA